MDSSSDAAPAGDTSLDQPETPEPNVASSLTASQNVASPLTTSQPTPSNASTSQISRVTVGEGRGGKQRKPQSLHSWLSRPSGIPGPLRSPTLQTAYKVRKARRTVSGSNNISAPAQPNSTPDTESTKPTKPTSSTKPTRSTKPTLPLSCGPGHPAYPKNKSNKNSSFLDKLRKESKDQRKLSKPSTTHQLPLATQQAIKKNVGLQKQIITKVKPLFNAPHQRNLRACMVCSITLPQSTFQTTGCPNCEDVLEMIGDIDKVTECTSTNFNGTIAVMNNKGSWVSRWQRLENYVPGIYAVQVIGTLPADIIENLRSAGLPYVPRDGRIDGEGEERD
ncbi:Transcription elongation factor spt4 [Venturia nashicola]|uniref:Transcription elongation factor SPT4 n=1 Tax=Venturia nashicola TaxID=86259 RepID=A0A4Z1NYP8_9PEZI|nr:Transcription elongation factor spt4 [Venturia nashicola]